MLISLIKFSREILKSPEGGIECQRIERPSVGGAQTKTGCLWKGERGGTSEL